MYILHSKAEHGKYIDSNNVRWDITIATNPYPVSSWDVFDSVEDAMKAYGLTEIPDVHLYDAKEETTNLIQQWVDLSVVTKKEIDCPVLDETIVFDRQALINAMAVKPGMYWIGSSNVPRELDTEKIGGIQAALMTYVQSIYTQATNWRVVVNDAATVQAVRDVAKLVIASWPAGQVVPEVRLIIEEEEKKMTSEAALEED